MNETDFFDRDSNYQSNTSLVYKYVEPLIHEIIKCKLCPRLKKFRDKIVKNKRKQFKNE